MFVVKKYHNLQSMEIGAIFEAAPGLESLELVAMNDIVSTVQVPTTSMWNIVLVVQRMAVMPVDESLQYRMRNYRFCWQSHVYFQ